MTMWCFSILFPHYVGSESKAVVLFSVHCIYCRTIGEIFAVSIVQGGPPPNFFMPWCYDFISTGELDYGAVAEDDVADLDLKKQIQQVGFNARVAIHSSVTIID